MSQLDCSDDSLNPTPEIADRLDEIVVRIPCYEPAGEQVTLTGRALCNHGLLVGASGSGKTSILRWFLKSFIYHQATDVNRRPGLFVFDFNADDTVAVISKWAREVGREEDLCILSQTEGHLDLFATVHRLDHLSTATSYLMHGPWGSQQGDNAYWSETVRALIDTGLTICFTVEGKLRLETVLRFLSNWLITKQSAPADEALLGRFAQLCRRLTECKDKAVVAKLEMARATLDMWGKLDPRTKSILTSFLVDVLAPLTATETTRYLDVDRSPEFCPEGLPQGKIMVFSLPAAVNLEAAALLGKAIKSRLWSALQQRPTDRNQRLCAVVSDEYHYLASGDPGRSSDVTALATLRSRSVAVVVATQSLDHLASVMGSPANFRALLPNFGTHFFFRTSEAYAGALASNIMGNREVPAEELEQTALLVADPWTPVTNELVCPPGALAQLQPCQAYVSIAGGNRRPECIWLGANHESAPERRQVARRPSSDDALQQLRAETWPESAAPPTDPSPDLSRPPDETQDEPLGFPSYSAPQLFYDETIWYRLLQYRRFQCSPYPSFSALVLAFATLGQRPRGLETLPPCWWSALVRMTADFLRKHPMTLVGLRQSEGCLNVLFSDTSGPPEVYLHWIEKLERSLYPVRTRPLKRRDLPLVEELLEEEVLSTDAEDEIGF